MTLYIMKTILILYNKKGIDNMMNKFLIAGILVCIIFFIFVFEWIIDNEKVR